MQNWLESRAQISTDRPALRVDGQVLSYGELAQQTQNTAAALSAAGIQPGDHVAILGKNDLATVCIIHALIWRGAVLVPINTRLMPGEIDFQVKQSDCVKLLYHADFSATAALLDLPNVAVMAFPSAENIPPEDIPVPVEIDLDAPFAIIHTSGTSGQPKGAVLRYGNVFYSATASAYRLGHQVDDNWLCILPLYHIGGLSVIIRACIYGITVDLHEKFNVETLNHALTHDAVTLVSLVPTMLYRLLDSRTTPWSKSLRLVLLGGAAASPELMQRCIAEGVPVATTYGLSEAASQVVTATPQTAMHKPGTVGKPLMFSQVRVVDENGQDQPAGGYGEVIVKGPTVMQGYYNNPTATARTIQDGWLHTGDIGYLDADGDLWLVQRRSDLIVSGGENIYPAEVEAILRQHPAVAEAVVLGIDDPEWGQKVVAVVERMPGISAAASAAATITEAALIAFCRERLAGYKQPRRIVFMDLLPRTGIGKIQRGKVRQMVEGML